MPVITRHLVLDNGLQVTLRHAAHLKRSAAAVRVEAGSHDAPRAWPGLAHFLEHLLFLGTERFPLDDGLMRHVQRQGGMVNASTRERHTDFFFEVPPAALVGCLERLSDMLAHPVLGLERQLREREVIHAEFIAWSRNPEAQQQYALLQSVSADHPLSGFHAGNRFSLQVHSPGFQTALNGFHRQHYQGTRMRLSLAGPQSLDVLEAMARAMGEAFQSGPPLIRDPLPAMAGKPQPPLFACENLPEGAAQAIAFLDTWLDNASLVPLYLHGSQALLHLKDGTEASLDWLAFLHSTDLSPLNREYGRLLACREQAASALELARQEVPFTALDDNGLRAVAAVLDAMLGNAAQHTGEWTLPEPEPLLDRALEDRPYCAAPGLTLNPALPSEHSYAVLYLRWQVDPQQWRGLDQALNPLKQRATRIAATLDFTECADFRELRCAGAPAVVIGLVEQALKLIPAEVSARPESRLIPIRALLNALPRAIVGEPSATPAEPLWQAMACGFPKASMASLHELMSQVPGKPGDQRQPMPITGRRWLQACPADSENALLVFCPLPLHDEARGRLLAQQMQGPFYQRMRVELQLGYAVFSAFRQIQGQSGLLFGVQSPNASHAQLAAHIDAFIQAFQADPAADTQALAEQFDETAMGNADVAQWAWQHQLAGDPMASPNALRAALVNLQWCPVTPLTDRLYLANGPDSCER